MGKRNNAKIMIILQTEIGVPNWVLMKSVIFFADNKKKTTVAPNWVKLTQKDAVNLKNWIIN